MVFEIPNRDFLPVGVNVFDPANNFPISGVGEAGVPSGVGNTDSNLTHCLSLMTLHQSLHGKCHGAIHTLATTPWVSSWT
jgi:hypothetical protein